MRSSVRNGVVGATLALAILAAACGSGDGTGEAIEGPTITIGAQDFGESAILAEIYSQALADGGYTTEVQSLAGFRDLSMEAFDAGEINFAPEYAASMLEFLNDFAGEATGDAAETTELLQARLDEIGLAGSRGVRCDRHQRLRRHPRDLRGVRHHLAQRLGRERRRPHAWAGPPTARPTRSASPGSRRSTAWTSAATSPRSTPAR